MTSYLPTITAGPFVARDGKWTLIARRGCITAHVRTRDLAQNYDIAITLTDRAEDELIRGLAAEFRINQDAATAVYLAHTKGITQ